jgi:short-subunit dehydrogenase
MPLQRSLAESVIVITGASSGIGAATAVRLAHRGATVVLAARRSDALDTVVRWCTEAGGRALAVPTDVRDFDRVTELAATTVDTFGRLDGWVNGAGVASFGAFADASMTEFRRVVETNLLGVAYGSSVALSRMRSRGGVLVNVASMLSEVCVPYLASYNATKHAVRALTNTIRQELLATGERDVSVCTVLPGTVNTPFYEHAANHTGRALRLPPPVHSANTVARQIVALLEHPRREVYVGRPVRLAGFTWRLLPALTERAVAKFAGRAEFRPEVVRSTAGSLFASSGPAEISGGWSTRNRRLWRRGLLRLLRPGTV